MNVKDEDYIAKSIHVYTLPFTFTEDIVKKLSEQWKEINIDEQIKNKDKQTASVYYMISKYMTQQARNIFLDKENICTVYEFDSDNTYEYVIKKEDDTYELTITGIELHIYKINENDDKNIGVFFMKVINNKYEELKDIKRINEYGRRVLIPYIPSKPNNSSCADCIYISKNKHFLKEFNFKDFIETFNEKNQNKNVNETGKEIVEFFLNEEKEKNIEEFKLLDDDRMFLICLIRSDELIKKIEIFHGIDSLKDLYYKDKECKSYEEVLYSLLFVDASAPTCQNHNMRMRLLEDSVNNRWSDMGTIHAVTNTSLFCITGSSSDINDSVIKPFVSEYIYMMSLVLAQNAYIVRFSEDATESSFNVDNSGLMNKEKIEKLINLRERYVAFKNKIMILEFTNQEQGIEIYNLMQKQLNIPKKKTILEEQIKDLYEITNVSNDTRLQLLATALAIFAVFIDIIINSAIVLMTDYKNNVINNILIGVLLLLIIFITLYYKNDRIQKNTNKYLEEMVKKMDKNSLTDKRKQPK